MLNFISRQGRTFLIMKTVKLKHSLKMLITLYTLRILCYNNQYGNLINKYYVSPQNNANSFEIICFTDNSGSLKGTDRVYKLKKFTSLGSTTTI